MVQKTSEADDRAVTPRLPETPRLRLRRLRRDDVSLLDELDRDEGVLRYIDRAVPSLDEQRRRVQMHLRDYELHPLHGRFVAESPDGQFLGWFGLMARDRPEVPDLGYRLRACLWGQGLATEGAAALIDYAFEEIPAAAVEAETMFVNAASRRVATKCGMSYVRTSHPDFDDPLPGTEHGEVLYRITRDTWAGRRPR